MIDELTLRDLARQLYTKHGETVGAVKELEQMAKSDQRLYNQVTAPLLSQACYDAIRRVCMEKRAHIWKTSGYDKGGKSDRVKKHANKLLDMPLTSGKKLRYATVSDLMNESEFYEKQAKTMLHFSKFFAKIAEQIGDNKVEDVYTDEQLVEIQRVTSG